MDNGEEGLPSPPLDPGALLASTRANSIEMSNFLDDFLVIYGERSHIGMIFFGHLLLPFAVCN